MYKDYSVEMINTQFIVFIRFGVDCKWSQFEDATNCTEPCGGGTKTVTRKVEQPALFGGVDCLGKSSKEVACNVEPCPGILIQYAKKTFWYLLQK